MSRKRSISLLPVSLLVTALALTACAEHSSPADSATSGHNHGEHSHDAHSHDEHGDHGATEQRTAKPRLIVTYDGGAQVVDATTLEKVSEFTGDGYLRVNPAGDGRHAFISENNKFSLIDLGTWSEPHGDHHHFYTSEPRRTDIGFDAPKPGHVVRHDGWTVLFADGNGSVVSVPSDKIADENAERSTYTTPEAHHGVAVKRSDRSLVVSVGNEKGRTGAAILDADKKVIATSDQCPGLHGEGAAENGVIAFGCEDGVLLVRGNEFVKAAAPTPGYARIGNVAATEAHRVVLGDYKVDKAAKPERTTRVSLIDTAAGTVKLVDLPASYTFRSLARGQFGEALVLGTDGQLRIIDPESGAISREVKVIGPWSESANWQDPRPAVFTLGSTAYVTDPASKSIISIDIPTGNEINRATLEHTPDEISGVPGVVS